MNDSSRKVKIWKCLQRVTWKVVMSLSPLRFLPVEPNTRVTCNWHVPKTMFCESKGTTNEIVVFSLPLHD